MQNQTDIIAEDKILLLTSFPLELKEELANLLDRISIHSQHSIHGTFPVTLRNNELQIPTRVYWEEHRLLEPRGLSDNQITLLSCILTRHHNGFVREKHLKQIISFDAYWTIPYLVQLIGEYIVEIVQKIDEDFNRLNKKHLIRFIEDNPIYWHRTKSRVISYWDCYYRKRSDIQITGFYKDDYPGVQLVNKIEKLLL